MFADILVRVITYLVIVGTIFFIFNSARKTSKRKTAKMDIDDFESKMPVWILIVGIICTAFFMFLALASQTFWSNDTSSLGVSLVFLAFSFLGIFLIYAYYREKLIVTYNDFEYYPVIGKKREFKLDEITGKKMISNGSAMGVNYKFYKGKKKLFDTNPIVIGYDLIIEKTKDVPFMIKKKKMHTKKIFNASINEPEKDRTITSFNEPE